MAIEPLPGDPPWLTDRRREFVRRVEEAHEAGRPYTGDPYDDQFAPRDPRFEWVNTQTMGEAAPTWLKAGCRHLTPAPVDLRTTELVAWWCPDCGRQFDRDRWPVPDGMWVPLPDVIRPVSGLAHEVTVLPSNGFEQCEKWVGADALIDRAHIDNVPVVLPDGSTYIPLWQNPRMTGSGDLIPWTTWARKLLAPAWDLAKNMIVIMASTSPFLVPLLYIVGSMIGWWS
jgi:hypothetical protein